MKKKMSWITIILLIWLAVRTIYGIFTFTSDFNLLDSRYSGIRDIGSLTIAVSAILLILYVITIIGIYLHYNQDPGARPIRWGPIAGFLSVVVDVVGGFAIYALADAFIKSHLFYTSSSALSAEIASSLLGGILAAAILAVLLYIEFKREGQTGEGMSVRYVAPLPYTAEKPTSVSPTVNEDSKSRGLPKEVSQKYCRSCGALRAPNALFCQKCGAPVNES